MAHAHISVCEKNTSREEDMRENQFSKHQIRGWKTASASGLQGRGWQKRIVVFTDAGMIWVAVLVQRYLSNTASVVLCALSSVKDQHDLLH